MLGLFVSIVLAVAALASIAAQNAAPAKPELAGTWTGIIRVPNSPLRITLRFVAKEGTISGTIDIPQQRAMGVALADISFEDDRVQFTIAGVPGAPSFNGSVQRETITGEFTQNGMTFPFELKRGTSDEAKKIKRPQDPKPPFGYKSEEVSIPNIGVTLSGTLLKPPHIEKPPVVVFITGSGPQNRDEEVFDHRPFAVLADYLVRRGIASLRVDDRGVGKSKGPLATSLRDVVSDTAACIEHLKARFEFGPIGLIGHSEGALAAISLASKRNDIAFIVLLAGPAVDGKALMVEQNRLLFRAGGFTQEQADRVAERAAELFQAIIADATDDVIRERTKALIVAQTLGKAPQQLLEQEVAKHAPAMRDPWLREFLEHDPQEELRNVHVPLLGLWGEKDVQVAAQMNLQAAEAALSAAQNKHATLNVIPGVNHLFQSCTTGSLDEYALIDETISPTVLKMLEDWIPKAIRISAARKK